MDSKWTLRLTALGLALLLFFTVKSEVSPSQSDQDAANNKDSIEIIRDVPVEVLYDDANLIISGIPETVDVMIQGSSADVTQATLFKDFTIFADLKSLEVGQHQVAIQHENLSPNLTVTIEPALVEVTIDEKVTKEVTVEPEINTRLIGENYSLKNISVEPDKVTVTGAKKIIESISYIKATASPEELVAANFTQNVNVKVLDRDLNRLNVITSPEEVAVTVEVEPYSKQVPLTLLEKGKLADGLVIDEIKITPSTAKLYGTKSFIDSLAEYAIEMDVSKIKESGKFEVEVPIKEGITSTNPKKVEVQIDISKTDTTEE